MKQEVWIIGLDREVWIGLDRRSGSGVWIACGFWGLIRTSNFEVQPYVTRSRNNPTWDAISPSLIQPIVVGWLAIERREASTASRTMSGVGALVWATRRNKVLVSRPHRPPISVANTTSLHRLERRNSGHVGSLDLRAS